MKKVIYKYLAVLVVFGLTGCDSDDKTIDKVFDGVQTGAFLRIVKTTGGALNKNNPNSEASVTFEFDGQEAEMLAKVDVFITYKDGGGADAVNDSFGPVQLGSSLTLADFTTSSFGLPITTVSYTLSEALALGGLTPADVFGGDDITISFVLTLTDGRSFGPGTANGNVAAVGGFYSSPYLYKSLIVCPPAPGVWQIDMVDTWGDGWQTSSGGGGSGIVFELSDGTKFEVALCSDYGPQPDCIDGSYTPETGQIGTDYITVPEGTSSMVATFGGDYYGEIEFTITSPTGNVLANYGTFSPAGPIPLDYCNDN